MPPNRRPPVGFCAALWTNITLYAVPVTTVACFHVAPQTQWCDQGDTLRVEREAHRVAVPTVALPWSDRHG